MVAIEFLIILCLPAGIIRLTKKVPFLKSVGAVAICCVFGFLLSFLPIPYDKGFSQMTASVIVAVAIPLIMFGFDLRQVRSLAKDMVKGYGLQIAAAIICSSAAAWLASRLGLAHASQLGGMAAGLYVGNTPNMIAVGKALLPAANSGKVIIEASTADCIVGGGYFFLVLTIMRPLYKRFLRKKEARELKPADPRETPEISAGNEYDFASIPRDRRSMIRLILTILLAGACLAVGAGLELLINGSLDGSLYIMITVSVLGIAGSFVRPIRETKGSYQIGHYLFLMFSLSLCMSLDLSALIGSILRTALFLAAVQTACVFVHLLLCRLFRLDGGTALITNSAGLYGPPFIAPIAAAYGERQLIAPGIICGVVGLAVGNFLGIGLGSLLALIL